MVTKPLLKSLLLICFGLGGFLAHAGQGHAPIKPSVDWQRSSPAQGGLNAKKLAAVTADMPRQYPNLFGLLVIRHGKIAYEHFYKPEENEYPPQLYTVYNREAIYPIHSVTKSVTSTLIGIAVDQGVIGSLDETLGDIFPAELKEVDNPAAATVSIRHLLTMTAGFDWPWPEEDWHLPDGVSMQWYHSGDKVKSLLARKLIHKPGEKFVYNTAVSHLLSAILTKKSGMSTLEFAQRHLFGPLNISKRMWEPMSGVYAGGQGLHLAVYDIAKLGQLFLQKGRWQGQQIVSEKWVSESTRAHVDFNFPGVDIQYGYQWWVLNINGYPAYRAHGRGGQFVVVIPALDMVIAVNSIPPNILQKGNTMHYGALFERIAQSVK